MGRPSSRAGCVRMPRGGGLEDVEQRAHLAWCRRWCRAPGRCRGVPGGEGAVTARSGGVSPAAVVAAGGELPEAPPGAASSRRSRDRRRGCGPSRRRRHRSGSAGSGARPESAPWAGSAGRACGPPGDGSARPAADRRTESARRPTHRVLARPARWRSRRRDGRRLDGRNPNRGVAAGLRWTPRRGDGTHPRRLVGDIGRRPARDDGDAARRRVGGRAVLGGLSSVRALGAWFGMAVRRRLRLHTQGLAHPLPLTAAVHDVRFSSAHPLRHQGE